MSKHNILIRQQQTKKIIQIEGTLDEDFLFSKYPLTDADEIEFHLGKLKQLNSCGIREWIKWLSTIKDVKTKFYECPKVFVDQMNMIKGFMPANCVVESFYVPFFNEEVGSEMLILLSNGKEYSNGEVHFPIEVKDESGRPMQLDVVASQYFKFLKRCKILN